MLLGGGGILNMPSNNQRLEYKLTEADVIIQCRKPTRGPNQPDMLSDLKKRPWNLGDLENRAEKNGVSGRAGIHVQATFEKPTRADLIIQGRKPTRGPNRPGNLGDLENRPENLGDLENRPGKKVFFWPTPYSRKFSRSLFKTDQRAENRPRSLGSPHKTDQRGLKTDQRGWKTDQGR
jgi:hypothetical protein